MTDTYHTDCTALTRSQLNEFISSREMFKHRFIDGKIPPKEPSKQMEIGDIIHKCLLERGEVTALVAPYPASCLKSNGHINPTPAAAFRDEIFPRIARKAEEVDELAACVDAAMTSELGEVVRLATGTERQFEAIVNGRLCKCRVDIVCELEDRVLVYDLKVGTEAPGVFRRNAKSLRYWLQDAHYSAVIEEDTGKPVAFKFLRLEPTFPFRLKPYWYDPASRDMAREEHRRQIAELVACEESNEWRDEHDPILVLSPWEIAEPEVQFND